MPPPPPSTGNRTRDAPEHHYRSFVSLLWLRFSNHDDDVKEERSDFGDQMEATATVTVTAAAAVAAAVAAAASAAASAAGPATRHSFPSPH